MSQNIVQTSPTPINIPVSFDLNAEEKAQQVLDNINIRHESETKRVKEGRGAKNPKWGKGPSLQEQALYLQGMDREEYNRLYVY